MTETIVELEAQLANLRSLRSSGTMSVSIEGQETRFKPDPELASAISDIERRISNLRKGRITTIRVSSSKGL